MALNPVEERGELKRGTSRTKMANMRVTKKEKPGKDPGDTGRAAQNRGREITLDRRNEEHSENERRWEQETEEKKIIVFNLDEKMTS